MEGKIALTYEELEGFAKRSLEHGVPEHGLSLLRQWAKGANDEIERLKEELKGTAFHTNAFLTGSQVYGTPTEQSDIDLVVLVDPRTMGFLTTYGHKGSGCEKEASVRIGKLNLILHTEPEKFELWRKCTNEMLKKCMESGPVTREEACTFFKTVMGETDASEATT